jgi:hypothetical protein
MKTHPPSVQGLLQTVCIEREGLPQLGKRSGVWIDWCKPARRAGLHLLMCGSMHKLMLTSAPSIHSRIGSGTPASTLGGRPATTTTSAASRSPSDRFRSPSTNELHQSLVPCPAVPPTYPRSGVSHTYDAHLRVNGHVRGRHLIRARAGSASNRAESALARARVVEYLSAIATRPSSCCNENKRTARPVGGL